jgi:hypothetical protein
MSYACRHAFSLMPARILTHVLVRWSVIKNNTKSISFTIRYSLQKARFLLRPMISGTHSSKLIKATFLFTSNASIGFLYIEKKFGDFDPFDYIIIFLSYRLFRINKRSPFANSSRHLPVCILLDS